MTGTHNCFYCGHATYTAQKASPKTKRTRDHVHPIVRGGAKVRENIVTACEACNQDKGRLTLEEYRAVVAYRLGMLNQLEQAHLFPGEHTNGRK